MDDPVKRSVELSRRILYGEMGVVLALEQDRSLKIGWPGGEPKPRHGDLGFAPNLPSKLKLRYLGDLGSFSCSLSNANISVEGNAGSFVSSWMKGGVTRIEGNTDRAAGFEMSNGQLLIDGNAGELLGLRMKGGLIKVKGNSGIGTGSSMEGGMILVSGNAGFSPGIGMKGGVILINGRVSSPGYGAKFTTPEKYLNDLDESIRKEFVDSVAVIPSDSEKGVFRKNSPATSDWSGILTVPGGNQPINSEIGVDTITMINQRSENKPLGLRISLLQVNGKSHLLSPAINNKSKKGDIEYVKTIDDQNHQDDLLLQLEDLPTLDDEELDALVALIQALNEKDRHLIICASIDRMELLQRAASRRICDAIIFDLNYSRGRPAPSLLPIFGRAAAKISESGCKIGIKIPWIVKAQDIIISNASGADFVVGDINESIEDFTTSLRRELLEIGETNLNNLGREHLRASDVNVANISGLRLVGYERPMSHWLGGSR